MEAKLRSSNFQLRALPSYELASQSQPEDRLKIFGLGSRPRPQTNTQLPIPRVGGLADKDFAVDRELPVQRKQTDISNMNNDTIQGLETRPDYVAYVAVDWADKKHDVRIFDVGTNSQQHVELKHTPEDLSEFVAMLRRRFDSQPIALAIELKRGPLINFLCAFEFIDIYPIKTTTLSHFRKAFYPSGAKSDPLDCDLILEVLLKHPDRLEAPWQPDSPEVRLLVEFTEARRHFVDEITKISQKLQACLKNYYPLAIEILEGTLDNRLACDFLLRWPTLERLQKAKASTLRGFFHQHNCRSQKRIAKALKLQKDAVALTSDKAIIQGQSLRATTLIKQIRSLLPAIGAYDTEIKRIFEDHQDAFIFKSLPGAGEILAPRLLGAIGSQRERFAHSNNLSQYNGSAPVTERSGKQILVHWRWASPVFVRQSFVEFARWSVVHCSWARAYNDLLREKGDGSQTRLRKIAYKWSRIIHRCWKNRTAYDDRKYLESLRKTNSPIWQKLQQSQVTPNAAA